MKPTGVNMTNVKQMNRASVLRLLLRSGSMSRTDLAAELNLTTATLTSICSDFLQKGLLTESNKSKSQTPGRQKCPLEISRTYKYVLAISLHYTSHIIAITDLRGEAIAVCDFSLPQPYDARHFLKELANACVRLLWENHIPCEKVLGAGVSIVGSVNQEAGISLNPFKIFEEAKVPIREILEAEFPFPVCVENNMCAYLNAEYLFGQAQEGSVLAVKWGPGVGSASSFNGRVCKDGWYHSSEIGHTYFYRGSAVTCRCGRKGCLETGVSLEHFLEEINRLLPGSPALRQIREQAGAPSLDTLAAYLSAGCAELDAFSDACIHDLAVGLSNAVQVLSPDCVFLFGAIFEVPHFMEKFMAEILCINPLLCPQLFRKSRLDWKKEYLGPAASAVRQFLVETGGEIPPQA